MELKLALDYRVKHGEEIQFLEEDEQQGLNKAMNAAVVALPAGATRDDQVLAAREARRKHLSEDLPPELVPTRITKFLLQTAVNMRYATQPGHASIPRKAEGKQRPGVWWGQIQDALAKEVAVGESGKMISTSIDLDPVVAAWLVMTVWEDDKVQNGFPPDIQHWVNVLDVEFERLGYELQPSRRK